jgi:arginine repressor
MTDKENKEPTAEEIAAAKEQDNQETTDGTYSRSFEEFERSKITDPNSRFFFKMLEAMSTEYQDEKSEETRQLFSTVDKFKEGIEKTMKSPEAMNIFKKELERRIGKMRNDK